MPRRIAVYLVRLEPDYWLDQTTSSARRAESHAARQFLKGLLAAKLGDPASTIQITQEPNSKPRLANGELEFSLSHRNGWCAVALSPDCPVGVDLEPIQPFAEMKEVVAEYFPRLAQNAIAASTIGERNDVFFRWWTRIEAAVKAHGGGLDDAPNCLDGVFLQSFEGLDGLSLSVAALTREFCVIDWHLQLEDDVSWNHFATGISNLLG